MFMIKFNLLIVCLLQLTESENSHLDKKKGKLKILTNTQKERNNENTRVRLLKRKLQIDL